MSGWRPGGRCGCARCCPFVLQVVQEVADERGVEVGQVELAGLFAGAVLRVAQQQPPSVAVGGDGVRAGVALTDQPFGEERLQGRGEDAHGRTPAAVSPLGGQGEQFGDGGEIPVGVGGLVWPEQGGQQRQPGLDVERRRDTSPAGCARPGSGGSRAAWAGTRPSGPLARPANQAREHVFDVLADQPSARGRDQQAGAVGSGQHRSRSARSRPARRACWDAAGAACSSRTWSPGSSRSPRRYPGRAGPGGSPRPGACRSPQQADQRPIGGRVQRRPQRRRWRPSARRPRRRNRGRASARRLRRRAARPAGPRWPGRTPAGGGRSRAPPAAALPTRIGRALPGRVAQASASSVVTVAARGPSGKGRSRSAARRGLELEPKARRTAR